jgi:hypothetical protein
MECTARKDCTALYVAHLHCCATPRHAAVSSSVAASIRPASALREESCDGPAAGRPRPPIGLASSCEIHLTWMSEGQGRSRWMVVRERCCERVTQVSLRCAGKRPHLSSGPGSHWSVRDEAFGRPRCKSSIPSPASAHDMMQSETTGHGYRRFLLLLLPARRPRWISPASLSPRRSVPADRNGAGLTRGREPRYHTRIRGCGGPGPRQFWRADSK